MTELVNFIFHIIKISNFRNILAFKQVVRFQSPSVCLPSHGDGSFAYPKRMFKLMDKKIFTIFHTEIFSPICRKVVCQEKSKIRLCL